MLTQWHADFFTALQLSECRVENVAQGHHLTICIPVQKVSCMKESWQEIFMHGNDLSMHENDTFMYMNDIFMHENDISIYENKHFAPTICMDEDSIRKQFWGNFILMHGNFIFMQEKSDFHEYYIPATILPWMKLFVRIAINNTLREGDPFLSLTNIVSFHVIGFIKWHMQPYNVAKLSSLWQKWGLYWFLSIPVLRLLSSKAQDGNVFWKLCITCHDRIHWIALTKYSQMSTSTRVPGFQSFRCYFHHFVLTEYANSSIPSQFVHGGRFHINFII